MEQEFYRDEFEQLLKDTTEDFKMYPSRKVWHSIYNDLHPDRKWPSLAVCLLLLTTILYVGVTNNNAINNETKRNTNISLNNQNSATENISTSSSQKLPAKNDKAVAATNAGDVYNNIIEDDANRYLQTGSTENVVADDVSPTTFITNETIANTGFEVNENKTRQTIVLAEEENNPSQKNAIAKVVKMSEAVLTNNTLNKSDDNSIVAEEENTNDVIVSTNTENGLTTTDLLQPLLTTDEPAAKPGLLVSMNEIKKDTREKEWIEDFAFYNKKKPASNLLKGLAVQFYVTPSIGYRVMFKNSEVRDINASLVTSNVAEGEPLQKPEVNQQSSISMEAGAGIVKDINKKTRFKAGVQFNYTNYVTYAQPLAHPVQTILVLNNFSTGYSSFRQASSSYANTPGSNTSKLENKTIQISIPIGLDYKLLSGKTVSWYVGGTIQPSYVSGGNGYLTSADKNYFIQDMSLLRKFNVSTAVESFVSIKTGSGAFINLGPQFRYQLLSTYSKRYIFTEKPYNIGFKIGFTRPL